MTKARSRRDAIAGGVWGLLVGDALGVPFEFKRPEEIGPAASIALPLPRGVPRAHPRAPNGAWSDDGAQALCLLASLLERGGLDPEDFGKRLLSWLHEGYMAVDGMVFDVGAQTRRALSALRRGVPAETSGPTGEHDNGNGSLMRVLPLALWHQGSDEELVREAGRQSRVTHGHLRSQICCGLYCLWVRAALERAGLPEEDVAGNPASTETLWAEATRRFRAVLLGADPAWEAWRQELEQEVRPDRPARGGGSGYVLDSLRSARWAAEGASFEEVVRRAISLGYDTDTTAAIAAGFAGVRDGLAGIPAHWLEALARRDLVAPLIDGLVEACDPSRSRRSST